MMVKGNRLLPLAVVAFAAAFLAGCGSASNSGSSSATSQAAPVVAAPVVPFAEARFAFAPVTGAPTQVLMALSSELGKEALAQRITLVPSGDPSATYTVKGYLSAVGDVSGTILVYVWDIFDTTGRRVHRISGQETAPGGSNVDPWSGVSRASTANVARRTISSIVAWGSASS